MTHARDTRSDGGFAMYTVIMAMTVVLVLSAALANGSVATISGVNKDELAVRAFQAAEAGSQTALHRLNLIQPQAAQCVTTAATSPQTGSNWCAATSPESIGDRQSFTYQTSSEMSGGCTGSTYGTATSERCVVATGTVSGVSRRVIARVVSSSGAVPFPVNGLLGLTSVTIGNNTTTSAAIGSNGQLTVNNNASLTGGVYLWASAPAPSVGSNAVVSPAASSVPTAYVLSPPNMLHPTTLLDSKTSNDNGRLLAGANPADSCSGGNGTGSTCYTNTGAIPRQLSLGNNGSVTLGGGVYNFCNINIGNGASINIASAAKVIIFIDSPDRSGSGCVAGQGGITSGNNAVFSNPSGDPTALQLVIYGSTAQPTFFLPNNITLAASIYAPTTAIDFKNNGSFNGGISAKSINIKNNATWDSRVASLRFATTLIYFRGAWRQCNSIAQAATTPATGCL